MKRALHPLIEAADLRSWLESPDQEPVTLLDVRWQLNAPSQRPEYDKGHLPGAAWVEFETALSGEPGAQGRHPLPSAAQFESAMQAAGVSNERPVVVYDAANSLAASRCWWLLKYFGKTDVQVLDGGLAAWVAAGGELENSESDVMPGDFVATAPHAAAIDAEEAAEYADRGQLWDARAADRFRGENETIDPVGGHIPGAKSLPSIPNVTDAGTFLPPDDLALRFTSAGVKPESDVAVYCGSGVTATHLALALEASGIHPQTAVYIGSWSHWITDPERAVAVGDD